MMDIWLKAGWPAKRLLDGWNGSPIGSFISFTCSIKSSSSFSHSLFRMRSSMSCTISDATGGSCIHAGVSTEGCKLAEVRTRSVQMCERYPLWRLAEHTHKCGLCIHQLSTTCDLPTTRRCLMLKGLRIHRHRPSCHRSCS